MAGKMKQIHAERAYDHIYQMLWRDDLSEKDAYALSRALEALAPLAGKLAVNTTARKGLPRSP